MNKLPDNTTVENQQPDDIAPEVSAPDQEQPTETEQTLEVERLAETPRIWVGSLSDYNNGVLHGEWIDATQDDEDVYQQIAEMLAASPTTAKYGDLAEEYGIFDHDNFCGLQVSEYDNIAQVTKLARLVEEHGEAFAAWAEYFGREVVTADDAGEKFLFAYVGNYRRKEDYVEGLLEDLGVVDEMNKDINPILQGYVTIDYAMLAQDLELSGHVTFVEARDGWWWAFME